MRTAALVAGLSLAAAAASLAQEGAGAPAPAPAATPAVSEAEAEAAGRDALVRAYEKEYAFLANEEAALQSRLEEARADRAERTAAAEAGIAELEARLRAARREAEAERERLAELEERAAEVAEASGSVDAVLSQAAATRARYDRPDLPAPEGDGPGARAVEVERALADVTDLLGALSAVRLEEGSFFLADGVEVEGRLVRVGAIGALGVSERGAGALAPAGDGGLQLWGDGASAAAARAAAAGDLPPALPIYLYESLDEPVERSAEKTAAEVVARGGVIAYVIVGLGLVALLLLVARTVRLARAAGAPDPLVAEATALVRAGRRDEAAASLQARRCAAARVVGAMLPHLDDGAEGLESAASERLVQETLRIERFDAAVLVVAAVAPLLGLLGTVTGMITTFDVITVFGTGDPKLLSGGISEALITTQLGLTVAIPTLLLGNLLSGWADRLRSGMERAALQVALLARAPDEPPPPEPARPAPAEPPTPANGHGPLDGGGNGNGNGNGVAREPVGAGSGLGALGGEPS